MNILKETTKNIPPEEATAKRSQPFYGLASAWST